MEFDCIGFFSSAPKDFQNEFNSDMWNEEATQQTTLCSLTLVKDRGKCLHKRCLKPISWARIHNKKWILKFFFFKIKKTGKNIFFCRNQFHLFTILSYYIRRDICDVLYFQACYKNCPILVKNILNNPFCLCQSFSRLGLVKCTLGT